MHVSPREHVCVAVMQGNQPEQLEVLRMAKEISDALEFLHSVQASSCVALEGHSGLHPRSCAQVVHRDLKPANVLLDDTRTVSWMLG